MIEAASWRLAASLARRHPELEIKLEHPGGGLYDVLALRSGRGCTIMLNRADTVQVHERDDMRDPSWVPLAGDDVVTRDVREVVAALEQAASLTSVDQPPRSTPRVLVYRTLSALVNLRVLAEPAEICMGAIDTSGYGGGPAEWLRGFPEIQARIERGGESTEVEPRFKYWHVAASDLRVAFETTTSDAWSLTGRRLTLSTTYDDLGRSMPRLLAAVLDLGSER